MSLVRSTVAIAQLCFRRHLRSRFFASQLVLVALCTIAIPRWIGSGEPPGARARLLVEFALGSALFVLVMSTLWAASHAIPSEIESRRIQLMLSKPMHRAALWLGNWCSLLGQNALLLAVGGGIVFLQLQGLRQDSPDADASGTMSPAQPWPLVADRVLRPGQATSSERVRTQIEELRSQGVLPESASPKTFRRLAEQQIALERVTVSPGRAIACVFDYRGRIPAGIPAFLRYRFTTSQFMEGPVRLRWSFGAPGDTAAQEEAAQAEQPSEIPIPPRALSFPLRVDVTNLQPEGGATIVFDVPDGLEVLVREGSYTVNFVKAMFVCLCMLAFLAALGLTTGSLFTFPIASFLSYSVVLAAWLSRYITATGGDVVPEGAHVLRSAAFLDTFVGAVSAATRALTEPLMRIDILNHLSAGELLTGSEVMTAFLTCIVFYGIACALLGMGLLSRREIGVPR